MKRYLLVLPLFWLSVVSSATEGDLAPTQTETTPAAPVGSAPPSIPEDYLSMRDPFRAPEDAVAPGQVRTDLEGYPVDSFKMTAVMTGPDKVKAMLVAPDGKTFFVTEKMRIGVHGGVIKKITPEKIVISEKMTNTIGQEESFESEIRIPALMNLRSLRKEE